MLKMVHAAMEDKEIQLVDSAAKKVRQSRSQFIAMAGLERANKILSEEKNDST